MIRPAAVCAAAVTLVLLATLLPFLPGPYDPAASPLSFTARVFGYVGLLLVPFGALCMVWPGRAAAIAARAAFCVVWMLMTLAAFSTSGYSLAAMAFMLGASLLVRMRTVLHGTRWGAGFYLIGFPLAVFILQLAVVPPAVDFSRDRAIQNAAPLIADIEAYRATRGAYPPSLLSVWPDYKPGVIGIERYHYEPSDGSYNLAFEQIARELPTREFVLYNPRDEQVFTSHAMDLLQYSPERLQRARGYFAVHDTGHPHWKYFWFD